MSAFTEPLAQVRAALSWDFHAAPHDYHGNRLVPAKRMDEFIGLCQDAIAALDRVERLATDMERQAALDAERAAILSSAVGRARLLLNDASKESTALIDAVLSAHEEGAQDE